MGALLRPRRRSTVGNRPWLETINDNWMEHTIRNSGIKRLTSIRFSFQMEHNRFYDSLRNRNSDFINRFHIAVNNSHVGHAEYHLHAGNNPARVSHSITFGNTSIPNHNGNFHVRITSRTHDNGPAQYRFAPNSGSVFIFGTV